MTTQISARVGKANCQRLYKDLLGFGRLQSPEVGRRRNHRESRGVAFTRSRHVRIMDPAYVPALAALAGSAVGGLTSLATAWFTQHSQARAKQLGRDKSRRQKLYKEFIEEASKLYADALMHDQAEVSALVSVYALISQMRVLSSSRIVEKAETVVRGIVDTYFSPNTSFVELPQIINSRAMDPLRDFSNACHEELRALKRS
jgi:hypothetical protein